MRLQIKAATKIREKTRIEIKTEVLQEGVCTALEAEGQQRVVEVEEDQDLGRV